MNEMTTLQPTGHVGASSVGVNTAATQVGRLTINGAFLKEIKDDNRQLKSLWDHVKPLMAHPETAINHWDELVTALAELRDQLAIHFSLEEAFGYFDEAIDIAPRLSLVAAALRGQHRVLFEQIRDLADTVMEVRSEQAEAVQRFLRRFNHFATAFEHHEESELKLILDSFDDDLGEGD